MTARRPPPSYIEVELASFCNRQCGWCPNAYSERGQRHEYMAEATWRALLDDLAATRFAGQLAFHNYNEPLADPHLLARLEEARAKVPKAKLMIFTNGDLLTPELFRRLVDLGIAEIRVTLYPSEARADADPTLAAVDRRLKRLGVEDLGKSVETHRWVLRETQVGGLKLIVRAPRVIFFGTRGGAVRELAKERAVERFWPCHQPSYSAAIDFHGNLKLCCHIYDTLEKRNATAIVGNVGKTAFSTLWRSSKLNAIRRQLERADFKKLPVCAKCDNVWLPDDLPPRALAHWPQKMVKVIRSRATEPRAD